MAFKRNGSVITNTDMTEYNNARKRFEREKMALQKEQELKQLFERVTALEKEVVKLKEEIYRGKLNEGNTTRNDTVG